MRLTQYQLQRLLPNVSIDHRGKNLNGKCPRCGAMEFGISLEENHLFNCYRAKKCGFSGNIFTLLKFLGRTREFLSEREINIWDRVESQLSREEEKFDLSLPIVQPPLLWKRVSDDEYLRQRGFEDYQFEKFEVGRSKLNKDYITFLVRQRGQLVAYISRSERSKQWIDQYNNTHEVPYLRYNNSLSDFAKMLFGLDEIVEGQTTDVILVEGIFSKTKTDTNLRLDDVSNVWLKCCSTFGAKLSDYQIHLLKLKGVKNLIFWFEADVLNKIKPIVSKASLYFDIKVSYLQGRDPNDLDANQAFELLESSRDWLDFNTSYIQSELKQ